MPPDLAVIIPCVGYSDLLRLTIASLPIDAVIVLTSTNDRDTIGLCDDLRVRYETTRAWDVAGCQFNKAAAINDGLNLVRSSWVCCLDADIFVPFDLRRLLPDLDVRNLYSAKRLLCPDPHKFSSWLAGIETLQEDKLCNKLNCPHARGNYAGLLGYMQLWNRELYDVRFGDYYDDASIYDTAFGLRWRSRRLWLPTQVVHIGQTGINWKGKTHPKSN